MVTRWKMKARLLSIWLYLNNPKLTNEEKLARIRDELDMIKNQLFKCR